MSRLRALEPGKWLDLGKPAADAKYGFARGRAWTSVMPFAESLGGALLFGEGVHGYVDGKTGRYMDGLWLYEVGRHRWKALWPGTYVRNEPKLIVNDDGFPALPDGMPVPIATHTHGYQMVAWDSRRKRFMFMPAGHGYFKKALPEYAAFLRKNGRRLNTGRVSPWSYDIAERRWYRARTRMPSPTSTHGSMLFYVPTFDKAIFFAGRRLWAYDPGTNAWRRGSPLGPIPPFSSDATGCQDPKRERLYFGGGVYPATKGPNAFWIYDIRNVRFIDPEPIGDPGGKVYSTNIAMMQCNTIQDEVLVIRHKKSGRGIYAYNPGSNRWRTLQRGLPLQWPEHYRTAGSSGFYHPGLDLHFFHVAGDSMDNGRILVYRHKAE